MLPSLWFENSRDLTQRSPSLIFDLMASMLGTGNSTEYKEQVLYCITNIIGDNAGLAKLIKEKVPNLLQIMSEMIESSPRMNKCVLVTIMRCFESLVEANALTFNDMQYVVLILMITLRLPDPGHEVRSSTLHIFASLTNTQND